MSGDNRLSSVLHVLLHMAHEDGPVTSEVLAKSLRTNPVVVRRMMAGLRQHGYVHSLKGHGGGWTLARDLAQITLRDIYLALGSPALLAFGNRSANPECLIEQAVNARLDETAREAEQLLVARFADVTLAELDSDIRSRNLRRKTALKLDNAHAS
ncbi:MAG: transcriptional regulator [Rhodopseudomonas sp.]|nr:transcriptional regulator [Rhodopseudomonas sp.]